MSEITWTSRGGKQVKVEVADEATLAVKVDGKLLGEHRGGMLAAKYAKGIVEQLAAAGCSHCLLVGKVPVGVPAEVAPLIEAARAAAGAAAEAHRYRNLTGVAELRAAVDEAAAYHRARDRFVANDLLGKAPRPLRHDVAALAEQYPRAAAYLEAEGYAQASNHHKAEAGTRAMRLLEDGGPIGAAEQVLATWLPASAWDD